MEELALEKAAKPMDCVDDENQDEYEDDVIRSGAWLRALLRGRFDFLGLGERVHAVFQIVAFYGLLLYVLIEV